MASLTAWVQTAARFWYVPAAILVLAALIGYSFAYFRALRPRSGTLEWISMHDRPRLTLLTSGTLSGRDSLGVAGVMLVTIASYAALTLPTLLLQTDQSALAWAVALAHQCLLPAVSTALVYILIKQLTGSTAAAVLGGCLLGINLLSDPVATAFAAAAALLACRFAAAPVDAPFADHLLDVVLCVAALTVGCYFDPAVSAFAVAILLLLVAACAVRFVSRGKTDGMLPKMLATVLITVVVTTVLLFLPAAAAQGQRLPALLLVPFTADYYVLIAQRVAAMFSQMPGWVSGGGPFHLLYDWPLLLTGFLAIAAVFTALLRRRDGRGLTLGLLFLGTLSMWLLGGSYAMPLVCVTALGCVWAQLLRRGKRSLVAAGAGVLLGTTAIFNLFFYWYPNLFTIFDQLWRN